MPTDLSTLDATKPPDNEATSQGASRIRETRLSVINSFDLEHALFGAHTLPNGDGTFPTVPGAPLPGNLGRLFLDTVIGRLLYDDGAQWRMFHSVGVKSNTNGSTVTLPASTWTTVNPFQVDSAVGSWIFVIAGTFITRPHATEGRIQGRITIGGNEAAPQGQKFASPHSGILADDYTYYIFGFLYGNTPGTVAINIDYNPDIGSWTSNTSTAIAFTL
jgi:hypothetical protein